MYLCVYNDLKTYSGYFRFSFCSFMASDKLQEVAKPDFKPSNQVGVWGGCSRIILSTFIRYSLICK